MRRLDARACMQRASTCMHACMPACAPVPLDCEELGRHVESHRDVLLGVRQRILARRDRAVLVTAADGGAILAVQKIAARLRAASRVAVRLEEGRREAAHRIRHENDERAAHAARGRHGHRHRLGRAAGHHLAYPLRRWLAIGAAALPQQPRALFDRDQIVHAAVWVPLASRLGTRRALRR